MSIADIFAQLESGGGANVASQPASMVNPTYGQYAGFVQQYGSGAAGVQNYANQSLTANPNITVGDTYAGYVLGTGTPGAYTFSQLQQQYPSAASNFLANAGVSPNTPLASVNGDGSYVSGFNGEAYSVDPFSQLLQPGAGGLTDPNAGVIPYQYGTPLSNPTGSVGTGTTPGTDWWSTFWNIVGNLLQRVGLGLLGIILIGAAAWAASRGEFGKGTQRAIRSV